MGAAELADGLVGHLAWPLMVLTLCLVFRGPLTGMIKSAKVAGAELDFHGEWDEAVANAIPGAITSSASPPPLPQVEESDSSTGDSDAIVIEAQSSERPIDALPHLPNTSSEPQGARVPRPRDVRGVWMLASPHFAVAPSDAVTFGYGVLMKELTELLESARPANSTRPAKTIEGGGFIVHLPERDAAQLASSALLSRLITLPMLHSVRALTRMYSLAKDSPDKVTAAEANEFLWILGGLIHRLETATARTSGDRTTAMTLGTP